MHKDGSSIYLGRTEWRFLRENQGDLLVGGVLRRGNALRANLSGCVEMGLYPARYIKGVIRSNYT